MNHLDKLNDKYIVVIANPHAREIRRETFDFYGLEGQTRANRCNEFDRRMEALRGQGCLVQTRDIRDWQYSKDAVMRKAEEFLREAGK